MMRTHTGVADVSAVFAVKDGKGAVVHAWSTTVSVPGKNGFTVFGLILSESFSVY